MVPVVKLDARNVRTLPAAGGKRTDYTDAVLPGFVLRVSPTSARTFAVRYYFADRVRRFTLGDVCVMSLADARDQARRILARAAMGGDPQGEKIEARKRRQGSLSFGELGQRFLRDNDSAPEAEHAPPVARHPGSRDRALPGRSGPREGDSRARP
jgi:hypothetical protein